MSAQIRPMEVDDHQVVMHLADRLQEGVAPWRDHDAVLAAVRGWVGDSIGRLSDQAQDAASFVAVNDGEIVGFVCVSERVHFTGEVDTYIGELVVTESAEGSGIGRLLVGTAEAWGRSRGRRRISVDTGHANKGARQFYAALGFLNEDVTLSRQLD